jgi:uncharacterized membrane protein YqaE (UPF0057 family)
MTIQLNDNQQAFLMLLVFILPALGVWFASGMPSDKVALGLLASAVLSGILAFIKELLGWKPKETQ